MRTEEKKTRSHACRSGRIHSLQSRSQTFCSDRGTNQPTVSLLPKSYCRDIYNASPYLLDLLSSVFFSSLFFLISDKKQLFLAWRFFFSSSFFSLSPVGLRTRRSSFLSRDNSRWLFREFSTSVVCFHVSSTLILTTSGIWRSRIRLFFSPYLCYCEHQKRVFATSVKFIFFFFSSSKLQPVSHGTQHGFNRFLVCASTSRQLFLLSLFLLCPKIRDFFSDRILMDIATGLVSLERLSAGEQSETCIMLDGIKIEDHPLRSGQATLGIMLGEISCFTVKKNISKLLCTVNCRSNTRLLFMSGCHCSIPTAYRFPDVFLISHHCKTDKSSFFKKAWERFKPVNLIMW